MDKHILTHVVTIDETIFVLDINLFNGSERSIFLTAQVYKALPHLLALSRDLPVLRQGLVFSFLFALDDLDLSTTLHGMVFESWSLMVFSELVPVGGQI